MSSLSTAMEMFDAISRSDPSESPSKSLWGMPHKRKRRTRTEIDQLKKHIFHLCQEYRPLTVRNLFHLMVIDSDRLKALENIEAQERRALQRMAWEVTP